MKLIHSNHRVRTVSQSAIREALQSLEDTGVDIDAIPLDRTVGDLIVMANTARNKAGLGLCVNLTELLAER